MSSGEATAAVEYSFRKAYGRLVSMLSRAFGFHRTELVEDAVQAALMEALHAWRRSGPPAEPTAWLYRVAKNKLIDALRHRDEQHEALPADDEIAPADAHFDAEIADDELRMLFVCADDAIPPASQLVLALKILCGFSTREIALRLLTSEDNVAKRLARGRERLRQLATPLDSPPLAALQVRRESVLRMVYLLFNEGYSSTLPDRLIRRELCQEAIRLALLLAQHPACACPEGEALLALMHLHAARFDARLDGHGGLLLLEAQDRSKWDQRLIGEGMRWLERSGRGETFSRYHAEAAVAVEHCIAPTYAETDWREIVSLYETLERHEPSPLHTLNRAIALAQWQGPQAGLELLHALEPPAWLSGYYLWDATLGELERRAGHIEEARRRLERARESAPHPAERELIARRLAAARSPSARPG
jgi:RNA polymerase sigma factor (sigma-70 family)